MTRSELLKLHEEICDEARKLMAKKNHDYAGGSCEDEPFLNFERVAAMGITSTERGFLVRMVDKMSRLSTFCIEGSLKVPDESFHDTILDLINYGILLHGYISSKTSDDPKQGVNL